MNSRKPSVRRSDQRIANTLKRFLERFLRYVSPFNGCTGKQLKQSDAQVAQLVEQRIENPRVGGSNPPLGTIYNIN